MNQPKVLAITKRTAELCGTQSLLYGAGFDLVTATSMVAARSVINAIRVKGVIVCRHSWTSRERESIVEDLAANYPQVQVIMHCPGCVGCDEASHIPGVLEDTLPLTHLMSALAPAKS